MKSEDRLSHFCVNPNTCDICNGIVKVEDLRDPMPKPVIQVEDNELPGVCNLVRSKVGML